MFRQLIDRSRQKPVKEKANMGMFLKAIIGLITVLFSMAYSQASLACGGDNQRHCCITDGALKCDAGHYGFDYGPGRGQSCPDGLFGVSGGTSAGTCYKVRKFPNFCGAAGQAPCNVDVQAGLLIRSCSGDLFEYNNRCTAKDSSGYPVDCGDSGEFACNAALQVLLGITSCKSGLTEFALRCRGPNDFPDSCGDKNERACTIAEHFDNCKSNYKELNGICRAVDSDGFPEHCGGANENLCLVIEHLRGCKSNLYAYQGKCRSRDAAGFPTHCGDAGEAACDIGLQTALGINSCKSNFFEINGQCQARDSAGYPSHCGDANEDACDLALQTLLGISSCKSGLFELNGECQSKDVDGYPLNCGGSGENACDVVIQITLGITACKSNLDNFLGKCRSPDDFPSDCGRKNQRACTVVEHTVNCQGNLVEKIDADVVSICREIDSDGFPDHCGDENEQACLLVENLSACKPDLYAENSRCYTTDADGYPENCGDYNEAPCTVDKQLALNITSCKSLLEEEIGLGLCVNACGGSGLPACTTPDPTKICDAGLSLQLDQGIDGFITCGKAPTARDVSDADEIHIDRSRIVVFVHGRGGDLESSNYQDVEFLKSLAFDTPNVKAVLGIDWNSSSPDDALDNDGRRVQIKKLIGSVSTPEWESLGEFGYREFNARNHRITDISAAIKDALSNLETIAPDLTGYPISLIGYSFGGVLVRDVVYRHYDDLYHQGIDIADVITVKAPNKGGLFATDEYVVEENGETYYALDFGTDLFCGAGSVADQFFDMPANDGCQLGRWVQWTLFNDIQIDNSSFPQIRWAAVAGQGFRLNHKNAKDILQVPELFLDTKLVSVLNEVANKDSQEFPDSDKTVTTASALGLELDACFPYKKQFAPDSTNSAPEIQGVLHSWPESLDTSGEVAHTAGTGKGVVCFHEGAKYESATVPRDYQQNHNLSRSGSMDAEACFVRNFIFGYDADCDGLEDNIDNCPAHMNDQQRDFDGDGIGDDCDADKDGDLLPDVWEEENNLDPFNPNDAAIDSDNDGLSNSDEFENGLDPWNPDTDNDGVSDGNEVAMGSDPNGQIMEPVPVQVTVALMPVSETTIENGSGEKIIYTFSLDANEAGTSLFDFVLQLNEITNTGVLPNNLMFYVDRNGNGNFEAEEGIDVAVESIEKNRIRILLTNEYALPVGQSIFFVTNNF